MKTDIHLIRKKSLKYGRRKEQMAGRAVINHIVREEIGPLKFEIFGEKNQKPQGIYNGRPLNISISHAGSYAAGAVSPNRVLGLDIEDKGREVHPRLSQRIFRDDESELRMRLPVIQVWTMKEAALKWCGSGLRTSMDKLKVSKMADQRYNAEFDDGKYVELISFESHKHWISIAYDPSVQRL